MARVSQIGSHLKWVLIGTTALALAACGDAGPFAARGSDGAGTAEGGASTRLVERDVETPDVFSVLEPGLWDGRPSLGGVWVAHPTAKDPERVILRNPGNGKFVIGALFRRERDNPGPKLQVSSDAASALGLLAGQPTELSVIALRREEVAETLEGPAQPILDSNEQIATETLDTPAPAMPPAPEAAAPAAASAAPKPAASKPATPKPAAQPASQPAPQGGRNFAQLGIFSVEANANKAAQQLKSAGTSATIKKETSQGKTYWRVLAGPAATAADRDALLKKVKGLGYADAYFVSR